MAQTGTPAGLGIIDIVVVAAYLLAVAGMSLYFAWRQRSGTDYFLAGRRMRGGPLALSILSNQTSAVSLVGAPAFVALRKGGGLRWLQYEMGVPLAMLGLVVLVLPVLRRVGGASIYRYADSRFGSGTRRVLALAFLAVRGLSLGVILFASALVVSETLGWSVDVSLLAVGLFSVAYTSLGGIIADIWSDVVQLVILWGGTLIVSLDILSTYGTSVLIPTERARTLVFDSSGLGDGVTFAFWPMLIGGFFLYMSYYGCDQSQAQRLLAARDDRDAERALVWNGILRFPLVLTYCAFGVLLAGLLRTDSAFAALMQGRRADSLVPVFLDHWLPVGLRGMLFAAILAAAMSSIDSALNSLAAVTLEDVADRPPDAQNVWLGRSVALGWGVFAILSGLAFAHGQAGVLESINQVGSALSGPILAVFLLGVFVPGVRGRGATSGLMAGLLANLAAWKLTPGVSWLWWNVLGFAAAFVAACLIDRSLPHFPAFACSRRVSLPLLAAFAAMLLVLALVPVLLAAR
ncbi:MAG: sodium/solute symporter [Vicinamibacteria bacterium]|nr:sodium/solute symporter [Vicinamibacteria bacterium]